MTNEEMLLRALTGEELTATEFHPQTNKQAYLAYAVGLITDQNLLPEPRTNEEVLLREYCLNGGGGGGDTPTPDGEALKVKAEGMTTVFATDSTNLGIFSQWPATKLDLRAFDVSTFSSLSKMFRNNSKVQEVDATGWDVSNIEDFSSMFSSCTSLAKITGMSTWDMSAATDLNSLFHGCVALTAIDLSTWDTSKVTNFNHMFAGCARLAEIKGVEDLDTSSATNIYNLFINTYLAQPLDLRKWDVSKVTNVANTFSTITGELNITGWNLASLTDFSSFFSSFRGPRIIGVEALKTGNATKMTSMFSGCSDLESLDLSAYDVSKVESMGSMFYNCDKLTALNLAGWNTAAVTSMYQMFGSCEKLTTLDLTGWNTGAVTDMAKMFWGDSALKTVNGLADFDVSKVTTMNNLFTDCDELEVDLSKWDTSAVTTMEQMFYSVNAHGITGIENLKTGAVTSMKNMFQSSKLPSVDMSAWDTSKVTDMSGIFYGSEIDTVNMGCDTSATTNMTTMFYSTSKIKEILNFSAMNKAGMSLTFPTGTSKAKNPLKRLTFRTDLPEGQYAIRSAINISYCSVERDAMVEMFNSLPDISSLGLSSSYKKITITGNPCVTGGTGTVEAGVYEGTVADVAGFVADNHLGDVDCMVNIDGMQATVPGSMLAEHFASMGLVSEDFVFFEYPDVEYTIETLTADDRAIATNKGWTITG